MMSRRRIRECLIIALVMTAGAACEPLEDAWNEARAPEPSMTVDDGSGRVSIRGPSTIAEGDAATLTAEVQSPQGRLDFEWSLEGRGSLMSRKDSENQVRVIASRPGSLTVTVSVSEDGAAIGTASVQMRVTR